MASDRYNYVLTESAEADIDEAFDYIVGDLVNPDAASAFADELEEKLEEICKTPKDSEDHLRKEMPAENISLSAYLCLGIHCFL